MAAQREQCTSPRWQLLGMIVEATVQGVVTVKAESLATKFSCPVPAVQEGGEPHVLSPIYQGILLWLST